MQVATGLRALPRNELGLIPVDIMIKAAQAARAQVLVNQGLQMQRVASFIKKPAVRTGRKNENQFMTPAEADRHLQNLARTTRRRKMNLKAKPALSKLAKGDDMVAVGAMQSSCERQSYSMPDEYEVCITRYNRYRGCSHRHAGRKPAYKDKFRLKHSRNLVI